MTQAVSLTSSIEAMLAMIPASRLRAVTPSNSALLPLRPCRALWINDEGVVTVNVLAEGDTDPVEMAVSGPGPLPVRAIAVRTGGTATDIVAVY